MTVLKATALQFGEFFYAKRNKREVECEEIDLRQAVAVAGSNTLKYL
jgi:hypothetical protein